MTTTIVLVIIGIAVLGIGVWSWWFENGKADDIEESVEETKDSE